MEYYRGIIFLTANNMKILDQAVKSRVDAVFQYPDLSVDTRQTIWDSFVGLCSLPVELTDEERDELVRMEMNGRQMRNAFKISTLLADKESGIINAEHLRRAIKMVGGRPNPVSVVVPEKAAEKVFEASSQDAGVPFQGTSCRDSPTTVAAEAQSDDAREAAGANVTKTVQTYPDDKVEMDSPRVESLMDSSRVIGSGESVSTLEMKALGDAKRRAATWRHRLSRVATLRVTQAN